MHKIDLLPGTHIDNAAAMLVQRAPAIAEFNGIRIRARYATTVPRDIVAHYHRKVEERGIIWRNSPEGKASEAEQERRRKDAQETVDLFVRHLPAVEMDDPTRVLAWVKDIAQAADHVDVKWDRDAVVEHFRAWGWYPGVNCGDAFNGDDPRNFAGWIVGQWLACWHPMVASFIEDWRAKFGAT